MPLFSAPLTLLVLKYFLTVFYQDLVDSNLPTGITGDLFLKELLSRKSVYHSTTAPLQMMELMDSFDITLINIWSPGEVPTLYFDTKLISNM